MTVPKKETQAKIKPRPCELCGVDDGKTQMRVGGFANWSHDKCSRIGSKAIELYLRKFMIMPRGLEFLAGDIIRINDKVMKEAGWKKMEGGGWTRNE